jgi:hypothetical protein
MKKNLVLRGAEDFLSNAIVHIGRGHRTDEWGDGRYLDPAVEKADSILRKALWKVQLERGELLEQ